MNGTIRRVLSILAAALTVLFGAITLTVPMFDATAPAIITIALAAATFFLWPRRRKMTAGQRSDSDLLDEIEAREAERAASGEGHLVPPVWIDETRNRLHGAGPTS